MYTDALIVDSTITADPDEVVDGVLTFCPGTTFSLICSYGPSNNTATRWEFGSFGACPITHQNPSSTPDLCGPFTIDMISDAKEIPLLLQSLQRHLMVL